jgi:hypothetical protein
LSKYDKITNYNLSYESLKAAVKEFEGFVLGLSENDIWLFSNPLNELDLDGKGSVQKKLGVALDAIESLDGPPYYLKYF